MSVLFRPSAQIVQCPIMGELKVHQGGSCKLKWSDDLCSTVLKLRWTLQLQLFKLDGCDWYLKEKFMSVRGFFHFHKKGLYPDSAVLSWWLRKIKQKFHRFMREKVIFHSQYNAQTLDWTHRCWEDFLSFFRKVLWTAHRPTIKFTVYHYVSNVGIIYIPFSQNSEQFFELLGLNSFVTAVAFLGQCSYRGCG